MPCKLCGLEHRGWVSCAKGLRDSLVAGAGITVFNEPPDNPKYEWVVDNKVDNEVASQPEVANKHGKYADKEKRLAYMRELMRKRRGK